MPRLILFAPAERVIVDQKDNSLSLIGIMSGVRIQLVQADEHPPAEAAVPIRWSVLAVWRREAGDEGRRFEQRVQLFLPGVNTSVFEIVAAVSSEGQPTNRVRNDIIGFQVATPGVCRLVLSLREEGQAWREISVYEMDLEHVQPNAPL